MRDVIITDFDIRATQIYATFFPILYYKTCITCNFIHIMLYKYSVE